MKYFNQDFYPTPLHLALKMIKKVNWRDIKNILEPSSGDGTLIEHIKNNVNAFKYNNIEIKAIEIENDLQSILRGKGINVIDSDFLNYNGYDQFDLIIANFPFSDGHQHLLKAIDILFNGQIVCILNAVTIKNPFSNDRKLLVRKLKELNADIEYINSAFLDSERRTDVEIALIYIKIEKKVETDLFTDIKDLAEEFIPDNIDFKNKDVAIKDNISAIVREYQFKSKLGIDTIINFYRNFKYIGNYMELSTDCSKTKYASSFSNDCNNLTNKLKDETNLFIKNIRKDFWHKTLGLPEVQARLTEKRKKEFLDSLKSHENMEFTEKNVRQFMINLIENYEEILKDAIEEIFDMLTSRYAWDDSIFQKNIRYYNGWKTNSSFKVNRRVIIPYVHLSINYKGWQIDYKDRDKCNDIDKVMNYFDRNVKLNYIKISDTPFLVKYEDKIVLHRDDLKENMFRIYNNPYEIVESEYFKIKFYKKGTMHLTFKDENILRAFNIEAGKRKGWLPQSYGSKKFNDLTYEEKELVKEFEDIIEDYDKNIGISNLKNTNLLLAA